MTEGKKQDNDIDSYKKGRALRRASEIAGDDYEDCFDDVIDAKDANRYLLVGWKVEALGLDESDPLGTHAECTETALVELMKVSEANGVLTEKLRRAEYEVRRRAPHGTYDSLSKARKVLNGYVHRDAPGIMKALSWAMTQSVSGEGEDDA